MPAWRRRTDHHSASSVDNYGPDEYCSDDLRPGQQHDCCPWRLFHPGNYLGLQQLQAA